MTKYSSWYLWRWWHFFSRCLFFNNNYGQRKIFKSFFPRRKKNREYPFIPLRGADRKELFDDGTWLSNRCNGLKELVWLCRLDIWSRGECLGWHICVMGHGVRFRIVDVGSNASCVNHRLLTQSTHSHVSSVPLIWRRLFARIVVMVFSEELRVWRNKMCVTSVYKWVYLKRVCLLSGLRCYLRMRVLRWFVYVFVTLFCRWWAIVFLVRNTNWMMVFHKRGWWHMPTLFTTF